MELLISTNTTHTLNFIPRFTPSTNVVFTVYNPFKEVEEVITSTYTYTNGIMALTFDATYPSKVSRKYSVKDDENVLYRSSFKVESGE